jgi:hypothetical protein
MRSIFGTELPADAADAALLETDSTERPGDFADGSLFRRARAAQFNCEVWRTGPSGMVEALPLPRGAQAMR